MYEYQQISRVNYFFTFVADTASLFKTKQWKFTKLAFLSLRRIRDEFQPDLLFPHSSVGRDVLVKPVSVVDEFLYGIY